MLIGYEELKKIPVKNGKRASTITKLRTKYGDGRLKKEWGLTKFYYQLNYCGLSQKNGKASEVVEMEKQNKQEFQQPTSQLIPIKSNTIMYNIVLFNEQGKLLSDRLMRLAGFLEDGNARYDVELHIREVKD